VLFRRSKTTDPLAPFRPALGFSAFNALTWQVALGTPMVLFAERLGASAFEVGLAYSFVFLVTPIQVLATALLPRYGYRRVMLGGWFLRSLFLVPPLIIAAMAPSRGSGWMIALFIVSVFLFSFMRAIGGCAYLPWLYAILPANQRGKHFAGEQLYASVAGVLTLLSCAALFRWLPIYTALFWQYLIAVAGAALSYWTLSQLHDAERPAPVSLGSTLRDAPKYLLRPSRLRLFLGITVMFGVATAGIPPFAAYYLRAEAGLSPANILLFTTLQYIGVIGGATSLRNLIDRAGPKLFFRLALLLYALVASFWLLFLQGHPALAYGLPLVYLCMGLAASFWFSANLSYLPAITFERGRALAVSVHGAITALAAGLSPVVWGLFLKQPGEATAVNASAFQVFFAVALAVALLLLLPVARLRMPGAGLGAIQVGSMALRPFRALTYLTTFIEPRRNGSAEQDPEEPPAK
jgi:MFS family permease